MRQKQIQVIQFIYSVTGLPWSFDSAQAQLQKPDNNLTSTTVWMRYIELNTNIIMNNKRECKNYKTQSHKSKKYDVQALSHRIRPK